jgi:O-antigen ligase
MAALLAPLVGVLAPKGLAPLIFALGLWGWIVGWRAVVARPPRLLLAIAALVALLDLWALVTLIWTPSLTEAALSWINVTAVALALPPLLRLPVDETARRALVIGAVLALPAMIGQMLFDYAALRWAVEAQGKDFEKTLASRGLINLMLFAWPAALVLVDRGKWWLAVGLLLAAVIAVFAGVSNSAQLAAVGSVLAAVAAFALPRAIPTALAAVVAIGILTAPVTVPAVLAPANYASVLEDRYYSSLHRLYIWEFASQRIHDRAVAGWGHDASPHIPGGDAKLPHGGNYINMHPHNGSLQVWLEHGGIGAVLWAALLGMVAWSLRRLRGRWPAALATGQLVAALVIVHLSFGIWQTAWLAMLGFAAVTMRVGATHLKSSSRP